MNKHISVALLLLLAAACSPGAPASQRPPLEGARIGGAFALTDQNGAARTDRDFAGKWRIMYFGYTFCPDVCPVDVQNIAAGLKLFEKADAARAAKVVPIFVTVDPARDTPPVLRQFVAAFHPRLVGLTGSDAAIDAVAKEYGVYHAIGAKSEGGYMVDHSRQAYLMDPAGKPIALVPAEGSPQGVADTLATWVK